MIAKLTGIVDSTGTDWVVLDVNGVGYLLSCSNRTLSRLAVGERPAREGLPGPLPALEDQAGMPPVVGQRVPQAAAASQARRVELERAVAQRVAEQRVRQAAVARWAVRAESLRARVVPGGRVVSPAREVRALGARPGPEGRP